MTDAEIADAAFARCHAITGHVGPRQRPAVPNRVAELECRIGRQCTTILGLLAQRDAMTVELERQGAVTAMLRNQLEAMTAERDALSRPKPAQPPAFPANALRVRHG